MGASMFTWQRCLTRMSDISLGFALGFVAAFLVIVGAQKTHAAEPTFHTLKQPPLMAHGVMQCDEVIALWVLALGDDGLVHAYRTDAMNHPDTPEEYNAFLAWVDTTPKNQNDILVLPCLKEKAK